MKSILFAYDGMQNAIAAKQYVISILEQGDTLHMLHVIAKDLLHYGYVDQLATQDSKEEFIQYIKDLGIEECIKFLQPFSNEIEVLGFQTKLHVRWGNACDAIADVATENSCTVTVIADGAWDINWQQDYAQLSKKINHPFAII